MENLLLNPTLWIGIGFVIVLLIIATKGKGAVMNSAYDRIERISEEIRSVEQIREDAQVVLQDQEKRYREVLDEMKELVEGSHTESSTISKNMAEKTKQAIETATNRANDAILRAEIDATAQIKGKAFDKAIGAVNEVLKTPEVAEQIIDSSLSEIKTIK